MKFLSVLSFGVLGLLGCGGGSGGGAQTPTPAPTPTSGPVTIPAKANFHVFLLAGQSNMAGRGAVEAVDRRTHPRILALNRDGRWVLARDPIHYDKPEAGVGPGKSFAMALVEADPNITVGLIPAGVGGSPISTWEPGKTWIQTNSKPYDDAVSRTRRALQDGTLKGILWHQGESDSNAADAPVYEARLRALIARLRGSLGQGQVPFLIGQLGRFDRFPWTPERERVDAAHQRVARDTPRAAFVPSQGLVSRDGLHFVSASARELGRRYAIEYFLIR